MFGKILIANRGEIAVRVLRACREMGIPAAVVYSEADRAARHVQLADEAVCIGPPPAVQSYLDMSRILDAARRTGADAVHPGYGFLAENPEFAERCLDAGLVFIGPTPAAMRRLGNKLAARRLAEAHGVPVIPGMLEEGGSDAECAARARAMGYPVLIKAAAGGGGKGMRRVDAEAQLSEALAGARRESAAAFGDATVYLEKLIERPRHVEFQVLADLHGAAVHLGERECSIQRRHQKIIEETPSPALTPEGRERMGAAAVAVVRAAGYTNAGTVEFLLAPDGAFYFLEMNARIQVEHPVTEMATGIDLVQAQVRLAAGEPLPWSQTDIRPRGHAMECRIYSENPADGFRPAAGEILYLREPAGPGVRVDSGIAAGSPASVWYDPILAKIIAWGGDREQARRRMVRALAETVLLGIETPLEYLRAVLEHPDFAAGRTHTGFLDEHFAGWSPAPASEEERRLAALTTALVKFHRRPAASAAGSGTGEPPTPWQTLGKWENA